MVSIYTAKIIGWVYILIYTIGFLIYGFFGPTATNFDYTYQRNYKPTDIFYSQWWTPQFFYIGSIVFLCLVPITLAFGMDDTQGSQTRAGTVVFRRIIFHLVVVVILLVWFGITTLIFQSINWANANRGDASNVYNQANDPRFCCFYFNLEVGCFTKQACNAGGSISELTVNGVFLFNYWFSVAYILLMVVDVVIVLLVIQPAFQEGQGGIELAESLIPTGSSNREARALSYKHRK